MCLRLLRIGYLSCVAQSLDLQLTPLNAPARSLSDWLTTFPLVPVILDPYTHESAWILDTARRILAHFAGADCRPCWVVTCNAEDARTYLGPYAEEFLTFVDPDRVLAQGLGVTSAPAFLLVRQDGEVVAKAEGWNSLEWRSVAEAVAEHTQWSRPSVPAAGDPSPFGGSPISA
jgi:hypothetical protein